MKALRTVRNRPVPEQREGARGRSGGPDAKEAGVSQAPTLSLLIPVFNEIENLDLLYQRLVESLEPLGEPFEVLLVDDGSTDGSVARIREICARDGRFSLLGLNRNFGQTAAMAAGIDHARGEIVITLDADLQNDPADIPRLLEIYRQGYDLVSGWRRKRNDAWLSRTLPSRMANGLISWITGVHLHDYGCTLKAYRRDLLQQLDLYGEMHRFLPALLAHLGARITEVEVTHHPRHAGTSKYGLGRTGKVLLDLMTVKFLGSWATKPIYLFGGMGFLCLFLGLLSGLTLIGLKVLAGISMILTPLPLLTAMLLILGIQFLLMGLLAEIQVRTYHESQQKKIYVLREVVAPRDTAASDPAATSPAADRTAAGPDGAPPA